MKKKSLLETNPYLKDPQNREAMITRAVLSSSAIEGVRAAASRALSSRLSAGQGGRSHKASKSSK